MTKNIQMGLKAFISPCTFNVHIKKKKKQDWNWKVPKHSLDSIVPFCRFSWSSVLGLLLLSSASQAFFILPFWVLPFSWCFFPLLWPFACTPWPFETTDEPLATVVDPLALPLWVSCWVFFGSLLPFTYAWYQKFENSTKKKVPYIQMRWMNRGTW